MGIENVAVQRDTYEPAGASAPVKVKRGVKRGQSTEMKKLHGQLLNWWQAERDVQAFNRNEMAVDEDFYDGLQWSDEDAQALMERGQAPLVYNHIKPTVNWLLGTERRTRTDGVVLPRSDDDEEGAQVKSKLLKYLSDVNRLPFSRSRAWEDCVTAGVGWLEDVISTDPSQEMLLSRSESWRNVWYDSQSIEKDMNLDARYVFRRKDLDMDYAIALCPEYKTELKAMALDAQQLSDDDGYYLGTRLSARNDGDYSGISHRNSYAGTTSSTVETHRERVRLIECWYKVPKKSKLLRGSGPLEGEEYDENDPEHCEACENGEYSITPHVGMEMRVALMTESMILYESKSPYKHNRFPLTPMWCYRRKRDNAPYGVIRDIRDPQEDYNKRASKALFILSTNRVVMDSGAVEDVEEARAEVARPDSMIVVKQGLRFDIDQDKQLAEQHLMLMDRNKQAILDVGGVTNQNLGQDNQGLSGKAIGKLQDQGSVVNTPLFDNRLLALQIQCENQLSLIEQFYTAEKVVRLVGEKKPVEWLKINQFDETTGKYINDITKSKADYVIDEQDFKASARQAMFESFMDLIGRLPSEIGIQLLDMAFDFADVPNKDASVARIRKVNGQIDPSRKPTPEEEQAMQANQAKQAQGEQMQMAMQKAQLDLTQAQIEQLQAMVKKINSDALKSGTTAAYEAMQGAQIIGAAPVIAPIADAILQGAGYVDQHGMDPNIPQPEQLAQDAQPIEPIQDVAPPAELMQADGAQAGIETLEPDGFQQPPGEQL